MSHLEANRLAAMRREMICPREMRQIGNRQRRPHGILPVSQTATAAPRSSQASDALARSASGQRRAGSFRLRRQAQLAYLVGPASPVRIAHVAHLVCLACLECFARHILQWHLERLERAELWLGSAAGGTLILSHSSLKTCPARPRSLKTTQLFSM